MPTWRDQLHGNNPLKSACSVRSWKLELTDLADVSTSLFPPNSDHVMIFSGVYNCPVLTCPHAVTCAWQIATKSKNQCTERTVNLGFAKIEYLISANNSLSYGITPLINLKQIVFLMNIFNSMSAEWRSVLKASTDVIVIDPFQIPTVPILDASSKQIYQLFLLNRNWHKLMNYYPIGRRFIC